jgi:excisionase family DNA binding protein
MGAYLSARESADYCGVSEKTIRNWIASGRLSAEKSAGSFRIAQGDLDTLRRGSPHRPQGADSASAEVRADDGPQGADESAVVAGLAGLVVLVDRLQVENRLLAEAAAVWQERARMLEERLALAPPQAPVEARTVPEPPDSTTEPSAPWWRRWRAWLAAGLVVAVVGSASCQPTGQQGGARNTTMC